MLLPHQPQDIEENMSETSPSVATKQPKKETISLKDKAQQSDTLTKLYHAVPEMMRPGWIQETSYAFIDMSAQIPPTIKFSEVLKPGFWANVVHNFQRDSIAGREKSGAVVRIRTTDHSYYADLYVRAVLSNGLIVQCMGPSIDENGKPCPINLQTGLPWKDEDAEDARETLSDEDLFLRWNVGKSGFDIIRRSDGIVIGDGSQFKTREAAQEFISSVSNKK
jgi:hypothetical protein